MWKHLSSRISKIALGCITLLVVLAGCSLDDLVDTKYPPHVVDPELFETEEGALALYRGTLWSFRRGLGGSNASYVLVASRMSDETTTGRYEDGDAVVHNYVTDLDLFESRNYHEGAVSSDSRSNWTERWYRDFHQARNQGGEAIHYLSQYAPYLSEDLLGHMHAIRGMAAVYLADAYCSGVPLTEYAGAGGMDYHLGATTHELYGWALAQFDTALTTVPDSLNYEYLASVGKGRALANLGRFEEAADAVRDVPTDFAYHALYHHDSPQTQNWAWALRSNRSLEQDFGTIGDKKGINGLPYVSSNDPRVPLVPAVTQDTRYPDTEYMVPAWMVPEGEPWFGLSTTPGENGDPIVVSSGIEARLLEAEAAAVAGDPAFLDILNTLRTTCADPASCPDPAPAGTGGVEGLPPLSDPGTREARLKMVFDEHAYWLFLTGQRQGALRRMVREHGFAHDEVYPTGYFVYSGEYGEFTNIPVPATEKEINTEYDGCFNRDP